MALFKILRGNSSKLFDAKGNISSTVPFNDGYCYFTPDNKKFYIDWLDESNGQHRDPLNSLLADEATKVNEGLTAGGKTFDGSKAVTINAADVGAVPTLTYEWNKELACGSNGLVCLGKFPCYDTNITIDIDSTASTTYHGTLVIATQNINTTGGGTLKATVYGDATGTLSSAIKIQYGSGSNVVSVYCNFPGWSKNLVHVRAISLTSSASDVLTSVTSIPTSANRTATNALTSLTNQYLPLSGGTLTGNLTGKYITGTWLQGTANNHLQKAAEKIAVFDPSGWVYHRTANELLDDIGAAPAPFKPAGESYLTFSSPNSFTLAVNDVTKHWDGTLEYFASNKTWITWDGTTTLSSVDNDGEHVLYLRGTGNTVITGTSNSCRWVLTGSDISCIGNIENLLDYATVEAKNHPTMANHCYSSMFYNCTSLTQAPALPATTLTDSCYSSMFYNCTSLTQAPALPATTLSRYCYGYMFNGCTSLTQAPALPATTLAIQCYDSMFGGCTALTQAPALPATTLEIQCYGSMFSGCTALTQAPALSATTLSRYCYAYMFSGCTSLIQAPSLPATTLTTYCYRSMFNGCISLKLSSIQTGEYTQEYRIPSSRTGTTATGAFTNMFTGTGGTFTGTPKINTTYYLSSDNIVVYDTEVATLREYVGSVASPASHIIEQNKGLQQKFWRGTQDEYDAIGTKSDDTMYIVTDDTSGGGSFASHISDSTIHITANERSTWNNKQNAITGTSGQIVGIGNDGIPVAQNKTIFYAGTSAPSDTAIFWIDTNANTGGLKYYNGSAWVVVPVAYS